MSHKPSWRARARSVATLASLAVAAVALAAGAAPLSAAVIYDNGAPVAGNSPYSDTDRWQEIADDFVLGAGANTIRGLRWTAAFGSVGIAAPPPGEIFTVLILADAAGLPSNGTPLFNYTVTDFTVAPNGTLPGRYDFFAGIPDTTLTPGTTYWLSIVDVGPDEQSQSMSWTLAAAGNSAFRSLFSGVGDWHTTTGPVGVSFQLLDEGPPAAAAEPATLALIGAGLSLFGAVRRRRRR